MTDSSLLDIVPPSPSQLMPAYANPFPSRGFWIFFLAGFLGLLSPRPVLDVCFGLSLLCPTCVLLTVDLDLWRTTVISAVLSAITWHILDSRLGLRPKLRWLFNVTFLCLWRWLKHMLRPRTPRPYTDTAVQASEPEVAQPQKPAYTDTGAQTEAEAKTKVVRNPWDQGIMRRPRSSTTTTSVIDDVGAKTLETQAGKNKTMGFKSTPSEDDKAAALKLSEEKAALVKRLDSMEKLDEARAAQHEALAKRFDSLEKRADTNDAQNTAISSQVAALMTLVTTFADKFSSILVQLSALSTQVSSLAASLPAQQAQGSAPWDQLTALLTKLASQSERTTLLKDTLSALSAQVSSLTARGFAPSDQFAGVSAKLEGLSKQVTALVDEFSLSAKMSSLDARVGTSPAFAALSVKVDSLSKQVTKSLQNVKAQVSSLPEVVSPSQKRSETVIASGTKQTGPSSILRKGNARDSDSAPGATKGGKTVRFSLEDEPKSQTTLPSPDIQKLQKPKEKIVCGKKSGESPKRAGGIGQPMKVKAEFPKASVPAKSESKLGQNRPVRDALPTTVAKVERSSSEEVSKPQICESSKLQTEQSSQASKPQTCEPAKTQTETAQVSKNDEVALSSQATQPQEPEQPAARPQPSPAEVPLLLSSTLDSQSDVIASFAKLTLGSPAKTTPETGNSLPAIAASSKEVESTPSAPTLVSSVGVTEVERTSSVQVSSRSQVETPHDDKVSEMILVTNVAVPEEAEQHATQSQSSPAEVEQPMPLTQAPMVKQSSHTSPTEVELPDSPTQSPMAEHHSLPSPTEVELPQSPPETPAEAPVVEQHTLPSPTEVKLPQSPPETPAEAPMVEQQFLPSPMEVELRSFQAEAPVFDPSAPSFTNDETTFSFTGGLTLEQSFHAPLTEADMRFLLTEGSVLNPSFLSTTNEELGFLSTQPFATEQASHTSPTEVELPSSQAVAPVEAPVVESSCPPFTDGGLGNTSYFSPKTALVLDQLLELPVVVETRPLPTETSVVESSYPPPADGGLNDEPRFIPELFALQQFVYGDSTEASAVEPSHPPPPTGGLNDGLDDELPFTPAEALAMEQYPHAASTEAEVPPVTNPGLVSLPGHTGVFGQPQSQISQPDQFSMYSVAPMSENYQVLEQPSALPLKPGFNGFEQTYTQHGMFAPAPSNGLVDPALIDPALIDPALVSSAGQSQVFGQGMASFNTYQPTLQGTPG
jgi:hypothetical protein